MLDFTAIDFETANAYRGSPCSVGLVRVRDGVPVETVHWLMRPPEGVDGFAPFNVSIHGITSEMVSGEPRWKDMLPRISEFIGNDVVVAHNAGFDTGVIRYACASDGIEWPDLRFLCTMVLARRALQLPSYRLPYVLEELGGHIENHHDALADASAVVDIVRALAAKTGAVDVENLASIYNVVVGRMFGGTYKGSSSSHQGVGLTHTDLKLNADPDGYLHGRVVVFTGALMSMTRQIAWDACAHIGATADENVTKRTNVLVVGDINPAVLRPGATLTGKAQKAFMLQSKGQEIEVMTEEDFLRCLDDPSSLNR